MVHIFFELISRIYFSKEKFKEKEKKTPARSAGVENNLVPVFLFSNENHFLIYDFQRLHLCLWLNAIFSYQQNGNKNYLRNKQFFSAF
jgi:hypothetical protein